MSQPMCLWLGVKKGANRVGLLSNVGEVTPTFEGENSQRVVNQAWVTGRSHQFFGNSARTSSRAWSTRKSMPELAKRRAAEVAPPSAS